MSKEKTPKEAENNGLHTLLPTEKITKVKYPIGGFDPGHYISKCVSCKQDFMGDKYARQCEPCAINAVNESNTQALARLHKLETALQKIKSSNDTINEVLGKN
jgi:hypothetical protein